MGLSPVADGDIAAVVTYLEMTKRSALRPIPPSPLRLISWPEPSLDTYRALFLRVGAPWLWVSRLVLPDDGLSAIIHDPKVDVYAVIDPAGIEVGMLEFDFRESGACEIAYFGLIPELNGAGHGRWLMAETFARCWRRGINRVWVHTCSLDHPSALNFYRAQGFVATSRAVETFPDPRLTGQLPRDAAPQIPLLGGN